MGKYVPVGGEQDAHGCYLMAGYSWNPITQRCERPWEQTTANSLTSSVGSSGALIPIGNVSNSSDLQSIINSLGGTAM
jgi:hypothetical protein